MSQMLPSFHTGEKVCVCDTENSISYSASQTEVNHTGDYPHRCDTCNKGFTWKGLLERHQRGHTGDKLMNVKHVISDSHWRLSSSV